jgi:hypothetical protein
MIGKGKNVRKTTEFHGVFVRFLVFSSLSSMVKIPKVYVHGAKHQYRKKRGIKWD